MWCWSWCCRFTNWRLITGSMAGMVRRFGCRMKQIFIHFLNIVSQHYHRLSLVTLHAKAHDHFSRRPSTKREMLRLLQSLSATVVVNNYFADAAFLLFCLSGCHRGIAVAVWDARWRKTSSDPSNPDFKKAHSHDRAHKCSTLLNECRCKKRAYFWHLLTHSICRQAWVSTT